MKVFRLILVLLAMLIFIPFQSPSYSQDISYKKDGRVIARFKDNGKPLVNPGMGWTLHYYSNIIKNYGSKLEPSDTLDDFPGLSVIYLRVPWAFLEPEEGKFNWWLFDTPAQRWIDKGLQIAMRVSCTESWMRYATPEWVKKAGAKGVDFDFGKGPREGGKLWEPDYLDPVFLQKLENFLSAMAKRYDGNPNVAFIDIGSFGMWGEGHTGFGARLNEEQTFEACKRHIDLHLKYFKKTLLCISDDMAGSSRPGRHFPITEYARQRGVTLRDDSILVQPPPNSWYHAELAQDFWPELPVILEHEHYGPSKQRGAWGDGSLLLKAVEDYHASYMSIHWWPREFLNENRQIIEKINKRIGYRINLIEVEYPDTIPINKPFQIKTKWANVGVAPFYKGGFMAITLKDMKGGIASVNVDESYNFRNLSPSNPENPQITEIVSSFIIGRHFIDPVGTFKPEVKPGIHTLYISIGQADGTPLIHLPLDNQDSNKRYKIGEVKLISAD